MTVIESIEAFLKAFPEDRGVIATVDLGTLTIQSTGKVVPLQHALLYHELVELVEITKRGLGLPEQVKCLRVQLAIEQKRPTWETHGRRFEATLAALPGVMGSSFVNETAASCATAAVEVADAVLAELDKES